MGDVTPSWSPDAEDESGGSNAVVELVVAPTEAQAAALSSEEAPAGAPAPLAMKLLLDHGADVHANHATN